MQVLLHSKLLLLQTPIEVFLEGFLLESSLVGPWVCPPNTMLKYVVGAKRVQLWTIEVLSVNALKCIGYDEPQCTWRSFIAAKYVTSGSSPTAERRETIRGCSKDVCSSIFLKMPHCLSLSIVLAVPSPGQLVPMVMKSFCPYNCSQIRDFPYMCIQRIQPHSGGFPMIPPIPAE